jgi:phage-related protein
MGGGFPLQETNGIIEVSYKNLNLSPTEPHTKSFGDGLLELRLKGSEGIGRVFYCTLVGQRIVMLHSFVKKTQKTPSQELNTALQRLKEIKNA